MEIELFLRHVLTPISKPTIKRLRRAHGRSQTPFQCPRFVSYYLERALQQGHGVDQGRLAALRFGCEKVERRVEEAVDVDYLEEVLSY